jgi:methylenetetrahydrofolate reductase (NADPH)
MSDTDLSAAIVALLADASLELMPRDKAAVERCIERAAPGTEIFISRVPGDAHGATIATATLLRTAGFEPVPHVGARYLENRETASDLLARLAGEAGVRRILCIAGDVDRPAGPFQSAADLIATGLLPKHGIERVGIAGYPEGHPKIAADALAEGMARKLALLEDQGIAARIVTQFCFEAAPIVEFVAGLRARGIAAPIRIGLAGPASVMTLAKFALRCGIGNSLRALSGGRGGMTRLLTDAGPEAIVAVLARAGLDRVASHFYTFGGVAKTADWLNAVRAGNFTLADDGRDFSVRR